MNYTELLQERTAGVLLHPTSLPGPYGIGDIGPAAYRWVDALAVHRQRLWQMLPLGPTGFGNSPYQSFSAFAGNPLLISPELLLHDGLLPASELPSLELPPGPVDYERVAEAKGRMLQLAADRFKRRRGRSQLGDEFRRFAEEQRDWLDEFALFMAIKSAGNNRWWVEWDRQLAARDPGALKEAKRALADQIEFLQFGQFLFFRQWAALRDYAHRNGIALIGDLPIFVAADSADVWSRPQLFDLKQDGRPRTVAGVPPDYFSATGQRWGNPLYRWELMRRNGFRWWHDRIASALALTDLIRLDHFRGFAAFWEVDADSPDASSGRWVDGPGAPFFDSVRERLGPIPLIAEDLGWITPDVEELRSRFGFPGMRILQFAFAGATEPRFLPYRYDRSTVVYTGTHDNDTTQGWFAAASSEERAFTRKFLDADGSRIHHDLIRLAWGTVANTAIAPLQDLLGLGSEARMNVPGQAEGNWCWRAGEEQTTAEALGDLGEITTLYGRAGRESTPDP